MRVQKTIEKKFASVDVSARVWLTENVRLNTAERRTPNGSRSIKEIAACTGGAGETIAVTSTDGNIYLCATGQGEPKVTGIPCDGQTALGTWQDKTVAYYAYGGKLFYCAQESSGAYSEARPLPLPQEFHGDIVRILACTLSDGIAVGIVGRCGGRYEFALSVWDFGPQPFKIIFTNSPTRHFALAGSGTENLEVLALGAFYQRYSYQNKTLENYKASGAGFEVIDFTAVFANHMPEAYAAIKQNGQTIIGRIQQSLSGPGFFVSKLCALEYAEALDSAFQNGKTRLLAVAAGRLYAVNGCEGFEAECIPLALGERAAYTRNSADECLCFIRRNDCGPTLLLSGGNNLNRFTVPIYQSSNSDSFKECFSVDVEFRSKSGAPLHNQNVEVWCGGNAFASYGGKLYRLKKGKKITLKTSDLGRCTLRLETDSLTAPELRFRLTSKMPNETLDILCGESVTETLGNVTTDQLKNARTPEGYLLPERVRSSIGELKKLANCITDLANTDLIRRAEAASESAAFDDSTYSEYLFEGIRAELIEVKEASANDNGPWLIKYVIEGIEKFYRFVIRCADDIVNAIYAVFRKFGVKTRDVFRWLAYLFEWDSIARTQNAIERLFCEGTLTAVKKAVSLKAELAQKIEAVKSTAKEKIHNVAARLGGKSAPTCVREKEREAPEFKIFTLGDPVSEMCLNDLTNASNGSARRECAAAHSLADKIDAYAKTCQKDSRFDSMCSSMSGTFRDGDSVYETSFERETGFINKATDFILTGVNGILASALDSAEEITAALLEQAGGALNLPFFSEFYHQIIGGQLTLLKLVSLLIAIPVTAVYKAERDRAPFENESDVDLFVRAFLEAADRGQTDDGTVAADLFALIGSEAGGIYYAMSAALALAEGTEAEYDLCIISGILDSIWTIAFFPLIHGDPDWSDWMLFVVAVVGVVMDFAYAVTTKKHIDSNAFGAIFTCVYGIVHLVFTVFNIIQKGSDGAEIAMAIMPCADEIIKILRLSKEMEITMLTVLTDIAAAGVLVFGGLKYVRKEKSEEALF